MFRSLFTQKYILYCHWEKLVIADPQPSPTCWNTDYKFKATNKVIVPVHLRCDYSNIVKNCLAPLSLGAVYHATKSDSSLWLSVNEILKCDLGSTFYYEANIKTRNCKQQQQEQQQQQNIAIARRRRRIENG